MAITAAINLRIGLGPPPVLPIDTPVLWTPSSIVESGTEVVLQLRAPTTNAHVFLINGLPPEAWLSLPGYPIVAQRVFTVTETTVFTGSAQREVSPGVLAPYTIAPLTVTVPVTPPPPPPPPGPFTCGASTAAFWANLLGSGYTLHSYALRSAAEAQYWPTGRVSTNGPNWWTYDGAEDALLLAIPEYARGVVATLAASIGSGDATLRLSAIGGFDPGDQLRIDSESMRISAISADQLTLTIARGQRGTSAAAHNAGAAVYGSGNSAFADIRLPSPSGNAQFSPPLNKNGNTYLILWDNKLDDGLRVARSGMNQDTWKHVQCWTKSHLSNPGGATFRWLEHRIGFCDGCAGEQPPDFNPVAPSTHVAYLDFRLDPGVKTTDAWSAQTGGKTLFGPNVTANAGGAAGYDGETKRHFIVDANVWFRRVTEIKTQVGDYDLVSSWAKSETRALTPLLVNMQSSLRFSDGETSDLQRMMTLLQLEIDSSKQSLDGREVGSVLKQWFRHVWIGRNVPQNVRDQILACPVGP